MDFIVVDTEGKDILNEIAIVDKNGELICEYFIDNDLEKVLREIKPLLESHIVVAHYAMHDKKIIENSYRSVGMNLDTKYHCTVEHSKKVFPSIDSYSLKYLSSFIHLKYKGEFFDDNLAHRASYDATFTYLLYKKILEVERTMKLAKSVNPFSSSKVDNPFQNHFDDKTLYAREFDVLLNTLDEVKSDPNHQTKSVVVLAEAGNGKTHLMMRFVRHVSDTNRFLFVGKPNDKNNILLHIYIRLLESFIQKIDGSEYSQLEYLLAKSISSIVIQNSKSKKIIDILEDNPLNIYTRFGKDGTANRTRNWKSIENVMKKWYTDSYGVDLVSLQLLTALVKYTFYTDENKRNIVIDYLSAKDLDDEQLSLIGLEPHSEHFNKEVLALSAISLFGKLSIFDEPLIISFDQLEAMSGDDELIEKFAQNIKELITQTPNSLVILNLFPNRWAEYESMFDGSIVDLIGKKRVFLERPNSADMRKMLVKKSRDHGVELDYIFTSHGIYKDILKHDSIRKVINRAYDYYQNIVHSIPLPKSIELSMEEKIKLLMARVEHLESLHQIKHAKVDIKVDFDIKQYINKVYEEKNREYHKKVIIDDKNDLDRLKFICTSIDKLYDISLDFFKIKKVMPEHVIIQTDKHKYVVGFLHLEGRMFVNRIKNFNQLVVNHQEYQFRLFRDARETPIRGKVSKDEMLKLQNAPKGDFIIMEQSNRVTFETIYQLIIDYKNKDIEIELEELMQAICLMFKDFWFCRLIR